MSLRCCVQLATRAGVPPGVINVVTTQANVADVGREMCENDTVRKVTFTGSTPVAKLLYGLAAKGLKKCVVHAPPFRYSNRLTRAAVKGFHRSWRQCSVHRV